MTDAAQQPLKRRAAIAGFWGVFQAFWRTGMSFFVFVYIINLLPVSEFGLFALANSYLDISRVIAGAGVAEALEREHQLDDPMLDTAFWGGIGITAIVSLIALISVPFFSAAVGEPRLIPLVGALAFLMVLSSISRVQFAIRTREFGHKTIASWTVATSIIGGVGAVVAISFGAGVWALLVQALISELIGAYLAWSSSSWRPRMRFSWSTMKHLLAFGSGITATNLLWTALARIPDFIIGTRIGTEAVGIYRIAWRIIELIGQLILGPLGNITFLSLSRLQKDRSAFKAAYYRALSLGSSSMMPVVFGLVAVAPEMIPALFGKHTSPSVPVAQILALSAIPFVSNYFVGSTLSAAGAPYVVTKIAVVQLISTLIVSMIAAPFGLLAITAAYVLRGYLTLPYQQYMIHRYAGIEPSSAFRVLLAPILASMCMLACLMWLKSLIAITVPNVWTQIVVMVAIGGGLYSLFMLMLDRRAVFNNIQFMMSLRADRQL